MVSPLNGAHCLHVYRNVLLNLLAEEMLLHEGSAFLLALIASLVPITNQTFAPLMVARIQSESRRDDMLSQQTQRFSCHSCTGKEQEMVTLLGPYTCRCTGDVQGHTSRSTADIQGDINQSAPERLIREV